MSKHPTCIPKTVPGILAWGTNFNPKILLLDTKYAITETLGENVLEDAKAAFDQWATLQGTRLELKEYGLYLTGISKTALEGDTQNIIVTSPNTLSPSPGQYVIMGGVLPRYSSIIDYLKSLPNFGHDDGLNLGIFREKLTPDENQYQSHVTLHRDSFRTTINCTKPGNVDTLGVEYRIGQEPDWHPLGVGIGTNAKWEHDFQSPPIPVNLAYRVTLYRRGHAIGLQSIASISSQP